MHPRRVTAAIVLGLALVACRGGEPSFKPEELPNLVLQAVEAPKNTSLDEGASGVTPIGEFTKDKVYQTKLAAAGFVTSYFRVFHPERKLSILATSFAVLFKTPDNASDGLTLIEEHIRSDGTNLRDIPADGLGQESFGIGGRIDPGFPPGFVYAWRRGNAVFGLIAAGDPGTIDESAARALAERMEARAP